jgi:hypothetical protein
MQNSGYICLSIFAVLLFASACANTNVNPSQARANTGYIDLYSPTDDGLCWDVAEGKDSTGRFRTIFSDVKPIEGDLLRLALSPGTHRLRVTFLNRVVSEPVIFHCDVPAGNILPVAISLRPAGQTTVLSKQTTIGGTPAGRGGRQTKVNREQSMQYELSAAIGQAFPYQPKSQINYPNQPR